MKSRFFLNSECQRARNEPRDNQQRHGGPHVQQRIVFKKKLPKTNIAPENGWLEDEISYREGLFSGDMLVSGRVSRLFRCKLLFGFEGIVIMYIYFESKADLHRWFQPISKIFVNYNPCSPSFGVKISKCLLITYKVGF